MNTKSIYIGFYLDKDIIEQLKVISLMTKKDRSTLIREGLDHIIEKHKDSFDKFSKMVEDMKQ